MIKVLLPIVLLFSGWAFAAGLSDYKPLVQEREGYIPPVLVIPSNEECGNQENEQEAESCRLEAGLISNVRFLSRLDCSKMRQRDIRKLTCKWAKKVTFADSVYGMRLVGYYPSQERCHLIKGDEAQFSCLWRKARLLGAAVYDEDLAQEIIELNGESAASRRELRLAAERQLERAKRKKNCALSVGATGVGIVGAAVTGSKLKEAVGVLAAIGGLFGIERNCG